MAEYIIGIVIILPILITIIYSMAVGDKFYKAGLKPEDVNKYFKKQTQTHRVSLNKILNKLYALKRF